MSVLTCKLCKIPVFHSLLRRQELLAGRNSSCQMKMPASLIHANRQNHRLSRWHEGPRARYRQAPQDVPERSSRLLHLPQSPRIPGVVLFSPKVHGQRLGAHNTPSENSEARHSRPAVFMAKEKRHSPGRAVRVMPFPLFVLARQPATGRRRRSSPRLRLTARWIQKI